MRGWGIQLGPYVFVEWHNFVILPLNNITVDFLKIHKSQFSVQLYVVPNHNTSHLKAKCRLSALIQDF